MSGKRPLDVDDDGGDSKRIRSNNGSPAPAPAAANGESELERKKREAVDKMAAIKARLAAKNAGGVGPTQSTAATPPPPPAANGGASDVDAKKAEVAEKMAAMKARLAAKNAGGAAPSPAPTQASTPSSQPPTTNGGSSDLEAKKAMAQRRIEEVKARIAAQNAAKGSSVNGSGSATPQLSEKEARIAAARAKAAELSKQRTSSPAPPAAPPPRRQDGAPARGGLGVGLHPSLMADTTPVAASRGKASGPKFSTTSGNQRPEKPKANPYLPAEGEDGAQLPQVAAEIYDPSIAVRKGGERKSRELVFNQKGKFMAQANALRQQARLEEMKRRIAAETRKVEIEEASDKSFLVPAPPDVEWWDEGLLPSPHTYTDCLEDGRNNIETPDSIITALVQHPVQLQPPQDRFIPAPKPLMLTPHEQKKLRRQRRMADMKEEQAKIRLGLVEPPPPKVKKSNMMRVLGEQAVKDPTAVEARVNREIAKREQDHLKANSERQLTKEEKAEKLKAQQAADEARGVHVCVFRVDNLSSGKHRYQVDQNAKQNALTGIVVLHPEMNLIIVEGGAHSIKNYKKLMLNRIKWTENTAPLGDANPTTFTGSAGAPKVEVGSANSTAVGERAGKVATWCTPFTEEGGLKDLGENRCVLVWEGDEGARVFKRWGSRAVETDGEARDLLGRQKMENMWTLARSK